VSSLCAKEIQPDATSNGASSTFARSLPRRFSRAFHSGQRGQPLATEHSFHRTLVHSADVNVAATPSFYRMSVVLLATKSKPDNSFI
jgi:hypothetical protein